MTTDKRISISALLTLFTVCFAVVCFTLSASAATGAPVAENLEVETYRGVSVGGRLSAIDPQGDALTYTLTTEPMKGVVEVEEDGRFVYTPADKKRGRDYFGFRAVDANGEASQEATVIIHIKKQKSAVAYDDMARMAEEYSAVILSERGVFSGVSVGGAMLFEPNEPVTRGEFLAMCMALTDRDIVSGVYTTGFMDDESMADWVKPYVSAAVMEGYVSGRSGMLGPVFEANEPVTCAEAAVMLDNVLSLTDSPAFDGTAPAWAAQAAANLSINDMLPLGCAYSETLDRADAARMLCGAMRVLENR